MSVPDAQAGPERRIGAPRAAAVPHRLAVLLCGCVLAACQVVPVEPVSAGYRVRATVDPQSQALAGAAPGDVDAVAAAWPVPVEAAWPEPGGAQDGVGQDTEAARLRAEFGSHISVRADGRVAKQYFIAERSGEVLLNLLTEPQQDQAPRKQRFLAGGGHAGQSILGRQLGEHVVEFLFLDGFEHPEAVDIRAQVNQTAVVPQTWPGNSLILVTAAPAGLRAFEAALNLFFSNVPQIEIDVKVVEYSSDSFFGIGIDQFRDDKGQPISGPTLTNTSTGKLIESLISRFPLAPPVVGAGSSEGRGLFSLGGIHDSWQLDAQLQVLESRGAADVVSNPRLTVRNGGLASVTLTTDLPYPQARITSSGQNVSASIVFKPVGINLNIRPVIAGTETVILQVFASVSAVNSFANTSPVPTPIIASREAMTSVHLSDGKTTVIGGLVSESTFQTETKFPILGDIPILGFLFRSTSEQTRKTTLEFHITPTILFGPEGLHGLGGGD